MTKKSWVVFSLIISVIALVYMFLAYYGFVRYYQLHTKNTEYYIQKYKKLSKADNNRVVISFTVDEKDLDKLGPFINSVLDQSVRVDDIALTVPYKLMDKIPKQFQKILSIYGISKDYQDANNLVPAILREPEATTKIIIVEPNMIYGEDFVADMVDASNKFPDSVIYGRKNTTTKGLLVKPEFFDDKLSQHSNQNCCSWVSDCTNKKQVEIGCPNSYKRWN